MPPSLSHSTLPYRISTIPFHLTARGELMSASERLFASGFSTFSLDLSRLSPSSAITLLDCDYCDNEYPLPDLYLPPTLFASRVFTGTDKLFTRSRVHVRVGIRQRVAEESTMLKFFFSVRLMLARELNKYREFNVLYH